MKIDIKGLELLIYGAFMGFIGEVILLKPLIFLYIILLSWIVPFSIGILFLFRGKRRLGSIINPYTLNPLYVSLITSGLATVVFYGLSIYFIVFVDITLFACFLLFFEYRSIKNLKLYTESQEMTERLSKLLGPRPQQNLKIGTEINYMGKVAYVGKLLRRQGIIVFDEALYKSLTETEFECLLMHEYSHYINMDLTKMALSFMFIVLLYLNAFLIAFKFLFLSNNIFLIIVASISVLLEILSLPLFLPKALSVIDQHLENKADRFSSMEVKEGCMKEFRETHEISYQRKILF